MDYSTPTVWIVEDVLDTGMTLLEVCEAVREEMPHAHIELACFVSKPVGKKVAETLGITVHAMHEVDQYVWVIFPWEHDT